MSLSNFISGIAAKYSSLRSSLRARVAFGVALPVMALMIGVSIIHSWRELALIEEQIRSSAIQLGDVLNFSISHAMIIKDEGHLLSSFSDVSELENVHLVQIIGVSGQVLVTSEENSQQAPISIEDPECRACHQHSPGSLPRAVELQTQTNILRISTPISNSPECLECHEETDHHLGVLLIDMSLSDVRSHVKEDLWIDFAITVFATLIISVGLFHLLDRIVVRRIEALREPLTAYAAGNYSVRLEKSAEIEDEICQLVETFNQMADEIARNALEINERSKVRQMAIVDERERIARELHDGVAQVLGYVTTKSNAVRIIMEKNRLDDADRHLQQLDNAAADLFVDIREAILGLRVTSQVDSDLSEALDDYVQQFNQMSEVNARLVLPADPMVSLPPETVLHVLRVVQEALTNARKHARATQIWVEVTQNNCLVHLEISDNGQGFTPRDALLVNNESFGLRTMQERADEIGAELSVRSEVGSGTIVNLNLAIDDE